MNPSISLSRAVQRSVVPMPIRFADPHFLRTFFVFDPRRSAILLIGGDKTGNDTFYERMVPQADRPYAIYLEELKSEGLI